MRTASASPWERNFFASRSRSASIRRYTELLTSLGSSMRLMRTSIISIPNCLARLRASPVMISIISARSPETTSLMVRLPNSLRNPSAIVSARRCLALCKLPPTAM